MTHFVYRPHIAGPENNITTPDILIERVFLNAGNDFIGIPVHRIMTRAELQRGKTELLLTPAYALISLGGGTLITAATVIREKGQSPASAEVLMPRQAWRLGNVLDHMENLDVSICCEGRCVQQVNCAEVGPDLAVAPLCDSAERMPRGVAVLCAPTDASFILAGSATISVTLHDKTKQRELTHNQRYTHLDEDRWRARPLPRYTVGPVGEVKHYI